MEAKRMNTYPTTDEATEAPLLETAGHIVPKEKISVELSTRFLEHFSEQLYSSPQKAFEELISNGWDAGADCVDVRVSTDLKNTNATMCVLDNGVSMDVEGLRQLWHIAFSPKEGQPVQHGRPVIGKFGIGKLSTYVLANKLTYICKAADGVIRRVTMDYGDIDRRKGTVPERLISELQLDLYEMSEEEVEQALKNVYDGEAIFDLIRKGVPRPKDTLEGDEFGAPKAELDRPTSETWTTVVLSDLKPTGRDLKVGVLRRMLEAALPFGSEMAICLNGTLLASSKINLTPMAEWTVGPALAIDSIEIDEGATDGELSSGALHDSGDNEGVNGAEPGQVRLTKIPVVSHESPYPHIELPGIGKVTGQVKLFPDRISGGKSDERGASNGFHVNVLGRVVNQSDLSFGAENHSHGAWAHFRMTVRADGLNNLININREQFKEQRELKIFRAFLRKVFNMARKHYDSDQNASLSDGGDVLVRSLGVLSLSPLRNVVSEILETQSPLPGLFDESGIEDRGEQRRSWRENTADHIKNALDEVRYEKLDDDSFVKFRIADNTIIVNKDHPFVTEHSRTKAEKELLRTMAMVSLLADVYALDIGVQPSVLESIRDYRDHLMRFRAMQSRKSGIHIAKLLLQYEHDSENSKRLEAVLSDALRYLGFQVEDLAKSGQPEGIASAYATPTLRVYPKSLECDLLQESPT
jgi:Histidine kinase-, DNA gyrase B-, and HSP90-like ATPase